MKKISLLFFKEVRKRKEKKGLEIFEKYNSMKIQRTYTVKRARKGTNLNQR